MRDRNDMPAVQGGVRSFLADYGVPLMVVLWTGISYALFDPTPTDIPRRILIPSAWDSAAQENYSVLERLGEVSNRQIGLAIIPALIIALLFYFDHNVSAQLAQQKDFQLVRPTAYHWDMWLLGMLMVCFGLPNACWCPAESIDVSNPRGHGGTAVRIVDQARSYTQQVAILQLQYVTNDCTHAGACWLDGHPTLKLCHPTGAHAHQVTRHTEEDAGSARREAQEPHGPHCVRYSEEQWFWSQVRAGHA